MNKGITYDERWPLSAVHDGRFGRVETRIRDGKLVYYLTCPGCNRLGEIDDDQLHGRVSVDHTDTGCSYHETHDFTEPAA